ncbi:ABC transporter ATP-binding protein [Nonomuraea mesophila]|uniref:ABC-type quaternary amine transporter n=1 Tax=Nonomuraea mesophila TaxID=2530382 RepID=A0A4R5F8W0_9ACTN|nr:ABC transporter ATP-binding protein [Nonomuraea mesophila]TDE44564.1 ABC transporter ATP-binding protein [Nonomuraea mesophila]
MKVDVHGLTLKYGDAVAVSDLDLTVDEGESLVLLGQSGCGKTSTMRCIAGLETPASAVITIGDQTVFDSGKGINRAPNKRNVGMVFQSYAIWPHMTVFDNVAFPLKMKGRKKAETDRAVHETLELVGLDHLADRGASLLSGGQMQRVALARSLAMQPSVLLLDEPLSNLDARLRHRLRMELRELQLRLRLTSLYVTHDQDEALALADRIALMQAGRIVQIGEPHEIYANPRSAAIAEFLGVDNVIPVTPQDTTCVELAATGQKLKVEPYETAETLRLCVRAEDVLLGAGGQEGVNTLPGTIVSFAFQGSTVAYRVRVGDGLELDAVQLKSAGRPYGMNDAVTVSLPAGAMRVLPAEVAA